MPNENTPDTTQTESLERAQIRTIATDGDFKPYLEVVNGDSQRTRAVIFVLIAALLLILTAYRNTSSPDWTDLRLARLQHAALCFENKSNDIKCEESKKYATDFISQSSYGNQASDFDPKKELGLELREQINVLIRQRTDALSLRLPFFGISIDMNDLGLICGLLLIAILYVLYASLKSETEDLALARDKGMRLPEEKRRDSLKLLRMAQVLASPSKSKIGVGQGLYLLFLSVPLLHLFVVWSDQQSYPVAAILQGPRSAFVETAVEWTALLLVAVFSVLCCIQQRKLNRGLDGLVEGSSSQTAAS